MITKRYGSLLAQLVVLSAATTAFGQARELVEPDVMLLIDSSGSMDWSDRTDDSVGQWDWARQQCQANATDQGSRTSWQKVQDAFLGKFSEGGGYKCAVEYPLQRPALHALDPIEDYIPDNVGEFDDVTYPHFRSLSCGEFWQGSTSGNPTGGFEQCIDPSRADFEILNDGVTRCYSDDIEVTGDKEWCGNLHPEADPRQNNGILDSFGSHVRFGAMTYDNLPKCWENCADNRHATRWDYGHYRHWNCGGIDSTGSSSGIGDYCYDWNAGARGNYDGAVGGLVGIGQNADSSNDGVADLLESMEPLFCSPLGALIDDAGYYFANDSMVLPFNDGFNGGNGTDRYYRCRAKIAVLISDGQPTSVFEFPAGYCTSDTDGDVAEWDPINANVPNRITHEDTSGPSFRRSDDGALYDDHTFKCPWRSSPEEAAEIFDVGVRALDDVGITDVANCEPPECWPLLLVVVGFNVPDDDEIDCDANPESCYWYTSDYTPCWPGLANNTGEGSPTDTEGTSIPIDTDPAAAPAPGGAAGAVGDTDETMFPMTPRQFLNEIACQGWPWDTATPLANNYGGSLVSHSTNFEPPWLDEFCTDESSVCNIAPGNAKERALFVDNVDDLAAILDMILVDMSSNVVTRTDLVSWNVPSVPGVLSNDVAQYEFRSGYVAKAGRPWQGILTRVDKTCSGSGADAVLDSHTKHNVSRMIKKQYSRDTRTIYSYYSETPDNQGPGGDNMVDWIDQNEDVVSGGLASLSDTQFNDCAFGVGEYLDVASDAVCAGNQIADIVREETLSRGLADIFNSTPAILGPPNDRVASASYQVYRGTTNSNRSPYMFVATNDGVLHAIDIDEISTSELANPEKWGFIPKSLLGELRATYPIPRISTTKNTATPPKTISYSVETNSGTGLYRHLFLLDGAPVARDVLLARKVSEIDQTLEQAAWRAVVFGSSGRNARTLYALDVTKTLSDPDGEKPTLRYEIAPDDGMYANNDPDDASNGLDNLGMPVSKPALAYVRAHLYVLGAAIVPGGYKTDPDPNNGGTTGVYVLRLVDGNVIRYLDPTNSDDICDGGVGLISQEEDDGTVFMDGAQMVGEPIVPHGTRSLNVTTHAFIGDDRGRLWFIDMYNKDPDDWCMEIYFDTMLGWHYPYENCMDNDDAAVPCTPSDTCISMDCCVAEDDTIPCIDGLARNMQAPRSLVIGAPAIAVNENNEDVLIFGSGQYDELTNWNRNRIFSLTDEVSVPTTDSDGNVVIKHTPRVNWWIGDDAVTSGDIFSDVPDGDVKNKLIAFQAMLTSDEPTTHFSPDTFPRSAYAPDALSTVFDNLGPYDFWNVGEKLIGRPVIFDQVAYFTTYVPVNNKNDTVDSCDDGASRVWALDYNTFDSDATTSDQSYLGKFRQQDGDATTYMPFHSYFNMVLSGVQVVQKPRCGPSDAGLFELRVQKANPSSNVSTNGAPADNLIDSIPINIDSRNDTSLVSVRFDSWSIVF